MAQERSAGVTPRRLGDSLEAGQALGQFRIVGRIGAGAMGDVYEGYDESLDRRVAVKVLPAELAREEDFVLRFHAEAAAAAKIGHPNVVPIYFIGQQSGHHYFAMQFVEGESLAQRLARQPRPPREEVLEIVAQCLAGLGAAHARGIVHRDVKPANILIDRETGRAMLADFGIVRRMDAATQMTATGVVLGTLDYIAPEQACGQPVDGRADLYSLGVVFYQMLAGRLPFTADTSTGMLFQHAYEKPFPLRTAAPDLPEPVAEIVERLLAKDPDQRYQDCSAVLADLRAFRERRLGPGEVSAVGEPAGSHFSPAPSLQETPWHRARDWAATMFRRHAPSVLKDLQSTAQQVDGAVAHCARRRNHLAKLLAESESIAADLDHEIQSQRDEAGVAGLESVRREQEHEREDLRLEFDKAEAELAKLRTQRDLMKARLQVAAANLAIQRGKPRPARRRRRVAAAFAAALAMVMLLWAGYALMHRSAANSGQPATPDAVPPPIVLPTVPKSEQDPAPVAEQRSSQAPEGLIVTEAARTTRVSPAEPAPAPRLRRNRSSTARAAEDALGAATSDREVARFSKMGWGVKSLAFSASGNLLAAGKMDRAVTVFDIEKRARVGFLDQLEGLGQVTCVAFTPDSRKLLAGGDRGRIQIWDVAPNGLLSEVNRFVGHTSAVRTIAVSADGRYVLSGGDEKKLRLWDLASGSERLAIDDFHGSVKAARFTGNDQEGMASDGEILAVLDLKQGKTVRSLPLARHGHAAQCVAIAIDGSRIAVSDNYALRLWDCRTGQESPPLQDTEIQWTAVFSPNNRHVVSGGRGKVNVWRLDTQRRIAEFDTAGSGYVQSIAVSADGRHVAAIPSSAGQDLQVFRLPPEVAAK